LLILPLEALFYSPKLHFKRNIEKMPRARRHYIPGYVWHITHRCHKKEFLLKFARDRQRWIYWLFEAKKRFGLCVLNYMVTSNHIHLLVIDDGHDAVISKSMQLVAGRTAQEYNQRKKRKGAFWEDRYHATAIERDEHLVRCLVYIDMNMVRTGVVSHPSEWKFCGFNEIQNPRQRYVLINNSRLMELLNVGLIDELKDTHKRWVDETLRIDKHVRESKWSQSVAVGSKEFVEMTKNKLGSRVKGRSIIRSDEDYCIREQQTSYITDFANENAVPSDDNTYLWNFGDISQLLTG